MDNFDLRKYLAEGRLLKEGRDAVCAVCGEHGYDEDLDIDCSKCGEFAWSSDYEGLGKKFDDVYENKLLKEVSINGKPVNVGSLTVDYNMGPGNRIDKNEKYFYSGEYEDGGEIGDEDLDDLAYDNPELLRSIFENKPLKEDKQPTHRITVDVYYSEDLGEATPEYELEDMYLSSDDFESTYIDAGMEGWYEDGEFETEAGSNTRLEPEYVEVIEEPDNISTQEDWEDPDMDDDYYDMVSDVG